jgi:TolA-binding protein
MAFLRQWFFIAFALLLGSGQVFAASGREARAYAAALGAFNDGMYPRAETEFAQFVQKYPQSDRVAEAVLLQAEAEFKQEKYPPAIALLQARKAAAGKLADQYVYWIGEAQFQNGDFTTAAETYVSLTRDFPESSLRLRGMVEAAAALAQTNEWPQVVSLLEETNSVFQRAAHLDPANELVSRGQLLLARAKLAQKDFIGAAAVLGLLNSQTLLPELDWQRAYWLYQVKLAAGDTDAALVATTNLVQIGQSEKNDGWQAEGLALRAHALEQLGQMISAVGAYQDILKLNAPPAERTRQAILKIAELSIALDRFSDAEESLTNFPAQFSNSPAADLAWLTLGELQLKEYVTQPASTNQLLSAQTNFAQFLRVFTNSPLIGKAYLDQGWCLWRAEKFSESSEAFSNAVQNLPPSKELAVARFKMGDAMFALTNYAGALKNYRAVIDDFGTFPTVMQALGERALYQSLRASLELKDLAGASNAMAGILQLSPASDLAGNSLLLVGEALTDSPQPAAARTARTLYEEFVEQFPTNGLRPQVDLAIARTYEQETNWPAAIGKYKDWLTNFPTDALRPQAEYARALAEYQAGNETNAFVRFTNFVAQFPTNDLAPLAQWWVADHFFRLGETNYMDAERNYKMLYQNTNWQTLFQSTNWQGTRLDYQARMMAGRAAMGLSSYRDAKDQFTSLTGDTNCPADLKAPALFAYGSALMLQDSPDTNNPLANFQLATNVFNQICQLYPTNELCAQAWIEIGKCDLQLAAYDPATNACAQAIASPSANISARSQAHIGFGIALEKKAALATGTNQTALLQLALDNYLAVFDTRFGENDPFWVQKAGLQALPLMESPALSGVADPGKFIDDLEKVFPQARDLLEKKRAALPPKKN